MRVRLLEMVRINGLLYAKGVELLLGRQLALRLIRRSAAEPVK